jgi:hypothetical protein
MAAKLFIAQALKSPSETNVTSRLSLSIFYVRVGISRNNPMPIDAGKMLKVLKARIPNSSLHISFGYYAEKCKTFLR